MNKVKESGSKGILDNSVRFLDSFLFKLKTSYCISNLIPIH